MSLTVSESAKSNYTPLEDGTYTAVCYMLVDCGMQFSETYKITRRQVIVGWEIIGETIDIGGEKKPRTVSKTYTASLSENSSLRKHLVAWRGRDFNDAELAAFDLKNIIGTACLIQIMNTTTNGKTYSNVQSIMRLPKGTATPCGQLKPVVYDIDEDDPTAIETLPLSDKTRDKIKASGSYQERMNATREKLGELQDLDDGDGVLPF